MVRFLKRLTAFILIVFVLPVAATATWWAMQDRPASWRAANWGASGVLPAAETVEEPAIYVMAARTGGMKGALSVHSWLVVKKPGSARYDRYDKVGWGAPVRTNGYPADAFWYSNQPWVVHAVNGAEAERLIPLVEAAIQTYPYRENGGYRIWPGPNSNSFIAHVLNTVPELGAQLPPNAVGRDFMPGIASLRIAPDWLDMHATLGGFVGFSAGARSGLEIHFMGAVAGVDFARPALKIPGFGRVELFR